MLCFAGGQDVCVLFQGKQIFSQSQIIVLQSRVVVFSTSLVLAKLLAQRDFVQSVYFTVLVHGSPFDRVAEASSLGITKSFSQRLKVFPRCRIRPPYKTPVEFP